MKKIEDITGFEDLVEDNQPKGDGSELIDISGIGSDAPGEPEEESFTDMKSLVATESCEAHISQGLMPSSMVDEYSKHDELWLNFKEILNSSERDSKKKKMFCRIDADLANTLDLCRNGNYSRSEMINAIVRTFIKGHIEKFKEIRQDKETLI